MSSFKKIPLLSFSTGIPYLNQTENNVSISFILQVNAYIKSLVFISSLQFGIFSQTLYNLLTTLYLEAG